MNLDHRVTVTRVLAALELLVLFAVLALAWKARSIWPTVPIADPDTPGYINPALTWLSGLGIRQTDGRDLLYPAFVALVLKTTGSFTAIVLWQRVLGLLSGVMMAVTWRVWVTLLPFNRWVRFLVSLVGALPIYMQLTNQQNILFEESLRPEAVLALFVYAQLACVMAYCKYRWQTPRPRASLLLGAAALVLAYACLMLKPSWYLACATTSLPVFAGMFGRALSWRIRLLTPILGMALSLLLLWLPAKVFVIHDSASRTLLPDALFCVHAPLIDKLLEARLAAMPDSDPEKAKLQAFVKVLGSELHAAANDPHTYAILGINADYLMHSDALTIAMHDYAGGGLKEFSAFCFKSFRDAVIHYPMDYARKVLAQFRHFLFIDRESFVRDHMDLPRLYRDSAVSMPDYSTKGLRPEEQEMFRRFQADVAAQIGAAKVLEREAKLRALRKQYARWAVLVEIVFVLALLLVHAWLPLRSLRVGGWAAFFLFLAPLGNALGVCIVHALDISRYRATLGGFLLFALTAMAAFIVVVLAQAICAALFRTRLCSSTAVPSTR